ncbi:MAG: VOC family protein [Proteobacteria bacterium]|nr:VOC family protein [Pseudomonadota bacterium]
MSLEPYLFFGGRCEEALALYREALGAEIEMLMHFRQSPQPMPPGMLPVGFEDKVMHASFRIGSARVLASDGCEVGGKFGGFSLSVSLPDEEVVRKAFDALAMGGSVQMPLAPTFWAPLYGAVIDRFGVSWMLSLAAAPAVAGVPDSVHD